MNLLRDEVKSPLHQAMQGAERAADEARNDGHTEAAADLVRLSHDILRCYTDAMAIHDRIRGKQ